MNEQPPHGPMAMIQEDPTGRYLLAALIVMALFAAVAWIGYRRKKDHTETKQISPLDQISQTLKSLTLPTTTRDQSQFFSQLSLALRRAIDFVYGIPALSLTVPELKSRAEQGDSHSELLTILALIEAFELMQYQNQSSLSNTLDQAKQQSLTALDNLMRLNNSE